MRMQNPSSQHAILYNDQGDKHSQGRVHKIRKNNGVVEENDGIIP